MSARAWLYAGVRLWGTRKVFNTEATENHGDARRRTEKENIAVPCALCSDRYFVPEIY